MNSFIPQMKPMMWLILMMTTLTMIMTTIIINFFTPMDSTSPMKMKKIHTMKWKW